MCFATNRSSFSKVGKFELEALDTQKSEILGIFELLGPSAVNTVGYLSEKRRFKFKDIKCSLRLFNTISVLHNLQMILLSATFRAKQSVTAGMITEKQLDWIKFITQ